MKHLRIYLLFLTALAMPVASFAADYEVIDDAKWFQAEDVVLFQPFAVNTGPVLLPLITVPTKVTLTNLNHFIKRWYLVSVTSGKVTTNFNIENPYPTTQTLELASDGTLGLRQAQGVIPCDLWGADVISGNLFMAAQSKDPYVALCDSQLQLRQKANGRSDSITWQGLDPVALFAKSVVANSVASALVESAQPINASVSEAKNLKRAGNDFALDGATEGLLAGQWYKATNFAGVFVSAMRDDLVSADILAVNSSNNSNLVNLVAIDLDQYSLGWNNGTEHPGVGWSPRAINLGGPGPDGFGKLAPLTFPGVVNPILAARTVGVLTGGFQRHHSAFRSGTLHEINRSSHYGFMEKGVVMSTLVPNLASLIMYADGTIDLKTWRLADNDRLNTMTDVRQNGVPVIETDPVTGLGVANPLVHSWGLGNWSGSGDATPKLQTPRTAACLVESAGKRFLIMTYFNSHTPADMVPVLLAYGCKYAIHLDMNQPVFSYSAFFTPQADGSFNVEHLSTQMNDDTILNGKVAPRWLLTPTYRDFFYVMRK